MWKSSFEKRLELLDAHILYVSRDTTTPLDYDEYNEYSYYYILNNNINMIYSDKELSYIIDNKEDPFTRLPITSYYVVQIRFQN